MTKTVTSSLFFFFFFLKKKAHPPAFRPFFPALKSEAKHVYLKTPLKSLSQHKNESGCVIWHRYIKMTEYWLVTIWGKK